MRTLRRLTSNYRHRLCVAMHEADKRGTVRVLRVEDDGDARDGDERHHALLYLHALHEIAQPLGDGIAAVLFDLIIVRDAAVRGGHEFAIFRWRQHRYSFRCGHGV